MAKRRSYMAAACMAACALATPPAAGSGAVSLSRDGAAALLEWHSSRSIVHARLTADGGGSVGHVAYAPSCASNLFVAWESISPDGTDTDLYAQYFGADGTPRWLQNIVVNKFRGHQRLPSVAIDGECAYVAWQSDSTGNNNIWCQRFDPRGSTTWATPVPVCTAPGDQAYAAIAVEPAGQIIVAWEDRRNGNADVFCQRFDPDGAPVGPEDGWAIEIAPGDQTDVRIECDTSGVARSIGWLDQRGTAPVRVETDLARLPLPEPTLLPLAACLAALFFARNQRP